MQNLTNALYNLKNEFRRKHIFTDQEFSLPSNLPKQDAKSNSLELAKVIDRDKAKLLQSLRYKENDIQNYTRSLRDIKKQKAEIDEKLSKFKDDNISKELYKQLNLITKKLPIEHIEFVNPSVTIFTTSVFKKYDKIMGSYRIWVDWSYDNVSYALRIVNVHHDSDGHPHPCVNTSGQVCMGNAHSVFTKYYRSRDLYHLIEAITGFIVADDIQAGYITQWDRWFSHLNEHDSNTIFTRRGIAPRS